MSTTIILDGKRVADEICKSLKCTVDRFKNEECVYPRLTIVASHNNDAGAVYIRNKIKRCEEIGIGCQTIYLDESNSFNNIASLCQTIRNPIIFQKPMKIPNEYKIYDIIERTLRPEYDVDGFASPINVGKLASATGCNFVVPCTPRGIMRLLSEYNISVDGKLVCIIGRSNLVGRPLLHLMEQSGATVVLCHTHTPKKTLLTMIDKADIIVSATGVRDIFTPDDIHPTNLANKVLIDVGMNRDDSGKLCGDINPAFLEYCYAYTPVPGGIGPMTVAMLMKNVVDFYTYSYI